MVFIFSPLRVITIFYTYFKIVLLLYRRIVFEFCLIYLFAIYFLHIPSICLKPFVLGVTADLLGFPNSSIIHDWFNANQFDTPITAPPAKPKQLKNPYFKGM